MLPPWKSQGNWDDSICEAIYTHHCCRNLSVVPDGPMLLCPCAVIHDCAPLSLCSHPWQCVWQRTLEQPWGQWSAVMDDCTGTKEHGTIWDHWQISATMVGINSLTDGIISVALWLSWKQHLNFFSISTESNLVSKKYPPLPSFSPLLNVWAVKHTLVLLYWAPQLKKSKQFFLQNNFFCKPIFLQILFVSGSELEKLMNFECIEKTYPPELEKS